MSLNFLCHGKLLFVFFSLPSFCLRFFQHTSNSIEEIRIEGHTSSKWSADTPANEAYFLNMQLSQARTLSVLRYVLSEKSTSNQDWAKSLLTANGLSSSRLIYDKDGKEDSRGSQRVEFKVRTNADEHIKGILEDLGQNEQ
ncbi:OmpA family protein [Psychrobacter raelei]|uniref:OmpA family protein n=1 Tax=Psychrobacter raelei TaxID=2565531 RepID=UPI003CE45F25